MKNISSGGVEAAVPAATADDTHSLDLDFGWVLRVALGNKIPDHSNDIRRSLADWLTDEFMPDWLKQKRLE